MSSANGATIQSYKVVAISDSMVTDLLDHVVNLLRMKGAVNYDKFEVLALFHLVHLAARTMNGHTLVKGKELEELLHSPDWQAGVVPWGDPLRQLLELFRLLGVFSVDEDDWVVLGPEKLSAKLYDEFTHDLIDLLKAADIKIADAHGVAINWIRRRYAQQAGDVLPGAQRSDLYTSAIDAWWRAADLALAVLAHAGIAYCDVDAGVYRLGLRATGGRMLPEVMARMTHDAPGYALRELPPQPLLVSPALRRRTRPVKEVVLTAG